MFSDARRGYVSSYGVGQYSLAKWSTSYPQITLSNGNLTATVNTEAWAGSVETDLAITGSVYVEITTKQTSIYSGYPSIGVGGQYANVTATSYGVYGISYNATTGAVQIRFNNTLIYTKASPTSDTTRRIHWSGAGSTGAFDTATINCGATAFTYTPVYI